jgi:hypothetical protein
MSANIRTFQSDVLKKKSIAQLFQLFYSKIFVTKIQIRFLNDYNAFAGKIFF